jgi:phenylalanyl-tRNA synthetase alpha chain
MVPPALRALAGRPARDVLLVCPGIVYRRDSIDLSVAVDAGEDAEHLGDQVREALGADADAVEELSLVAETAYDELPAAARARLGIRPGQRNLLVRLVLADLQRTLTDDEANRLRDRVYDAIHRGSVHSWASPRALR